MEGKYFAHCTAFYSFLAAQPSDCIHDPRGFFAALLAANQQKNYPLVLSIFQVVLEKGFWPNRAVVYAVTELYAKGDFWREKYAREMKRLQTEGEIDVNKQLEVLARSRLPQFISGAKVIGDFCNRNHECVITLDSHKTSDYDRRFLVIRSIENDTAIAKLLQQELIPPVYSIVRVR